QSKAPPQISQERKERRNEEGRTEISSPSLLVLGPGGSRGFSTCVDKPRVPPEATPDVLEFVAPETLPPARWRIRSLHPGNDGLNSGPASQPTRRLHHLRRCRCQPGSRQPHQAAHQVSCPQNLYQGSTERDWRLRRLVLGR